MWRFCTSPLATTSCCEPSKLPSAGDRVRPQLPEGPRRVTLAGIERRATGALFATCTDEPVARGHGD
jgi:hypothetical protein